MCVHKWCVPVEPQGEIMGSSTSIVVLRNVSCTAKGDQLHFPRLPMVSIREAIVR